MPYVKEERRNIWLREKPTTPGDLNYDITSLVLDYITEHGLNYNLGINAVIGAMECAKLVLYRRLAVPYEDAKILENGVPGGGNPFRRDINTVGPHIGDKANRIPIYVHAFIKALGNLHGLCRRETQLARGFLLQS